MELVFHQFVNGIMGGSVYALVAVGMTMIFGIMRSINFAHGEYYMIGAFGGWFVISSIVSSYIVAVILSLAFAVVIGVLISRLIMERLADMPFQMAVLATIGLFMILQNIVRLTFGGTHKSFLAGWTDSVQILGINIAQQRIIILIVTVLGFLALELMVRYASIGKAMRAVSQNRETSLIVGIDVNRIARYTFALGIGLAALSGVLVAPVITTIYSGMGETVTLKTFAVIVIGGMGNVVGTLLAGWTLGVVESFVAGYISLQYRDAVGFVALVAVLMWRPWGLFGRMGRF